MAHMADKRTVFFGIFLSLSFFWAGLAFNLLEVQTPALVVLLVVLAVPTLAVTAWTGFGLPVPVLPKRRPLYLPDGTLYSKTPSKMKVLLVTFAVCVAYGLLVATQWFPQLEVVVATPFLIAFIAYPVVAGVLVVRWLWFRLKRLRRNPYH